LHRTAQQLPALTMCETKVCIEKIAEQKPLWLFQLYTVRHKNCTLVGFQ